MSTTVQLQPKSSQKKPSIKIANDSGTAPHKGDLPLASNHTIDDSDVESLKKGIVKTSKDKAKGPYTILLVGEPGVGKSSFLQLIANVFTGNDIDHYVFDILDHTNEQGSSNNWAQTNSARLYEITSTSGVVVRILDTPGLVNTRTVQQGELHKDTSIETQIKDHIDSVTAVLILANGTVPRGPVGIDYTLSTLSTIFPKALTKNIALMFTNVWSPLCFNFCEDTVPASLQNARRFQIDNPFALQKKLMVDPVMQESRELRRVVKAAERNALETIVALFDWLDGLEPQTTTKIPLTARPAAQEAKNPATIRVQASKPKPASNYNNLCIFVSSLYSTCSMQLHLTYALVAILIPWVQLFLFSGLIPLPYLSRTESKRSQLFCG